MGRVRSRVADEDRRHAIRSSLAAISGAVHVLVAGDLDSTDARIVRLQRMLLEEVDRLTRLVDPDVDPREDAAELDLDEIIDHVVIARQAAGQQVLWTPTGSRVVGRRDEVVELLSILLVNAARHAPGAPAHVVVAADGDMVRLSVVDDGPGVPEHLRETIFERGARRPASPGEGLGLSIARDLVDRLGGTLSVRSTDQQGAVFDARLPRVARGGAA